MSVNLFIQLVFQLNFKHVLEMLNKLVIFDIFTLNLDNKSLSQLTAVLKSIDDDFVSLLQLSSDSHHTLFELIHILFLNSIQFRLVFQLNQPILLLGQQLLGEIFVLVVIKELVDFA